MKAWRALAVMLALFVAAPSSAHRLDEYLQATTLAIAKGRIHVGMRLAPGVAVFPVVFAEIDRNGDGVASEVEQRRYAESVLRDVSLSVDGTPRTLTLVSATFAPKTLLEEGLGEIQLELEADVPGTAARRRLAFENHHQRGIGVYLVNALLPADPTVQLGTPQRNADQSSYAIDYTEAATSASALSMNALAAQWTWLDGVLLTLLGALAFMGLQISRTRRNSKKERPCAS